MIIYLAGIQNIPDTIKTINRRVNQLESYFYYKRDLVEKMHHLVDKQFLDSGAFSAHSQGSVINLDEYIQFIKDHLEELEIYANLDVIGDEVATEKNQKYMEDQGLHPIPTFHYGEPWEVLGKLIDDYDYIALGGMVRTTTKTQLEHWLDSCWSKYCAKPDGTARLKVHGFGMTQDKLMRKYPWESVDSTAWVLTGRFGSVYLDNGDMNYGNKVCISLKSNIEGAHFHQLRKHDQETIQNKLLAIDPRFTVDNLSKIYQYRDMANINYFIDLQDRLTADPPIFQIRQEELF
jgi:hypothetical protein